MIEMFQEYWRQFLWDTAGRPSGLPVTLWLTLISLVLGFCAAIPLSVVRAASPFWAASIVRAFTLIFRGTPLYVQLLVIYSGLYSLQIVRNVPALNEFFRDAYHCTILAFALNTCAYTTEIFTGAIETTSAGEKDAARAFGFSPFSIYFRIILPSALRRALPAYGNEVVLMLHATTLAGVVTVPDLLKVARNASAAYFQPFLAYGFAALLYLFISFGLITGFRLLEARWLAHLRPRRAAAPKSD